MYIVLYSWMYSSSQVNRPPQGNPDEQHCLKFSHPTRVSSNRIYLLLMLFHVFPYCVFPSTSSSFHRSFSRFSRFSFIVNCTYEWISATAYMHIVVFCSLPFSAYSVCGRVFLIHHYSLSSTRHLACSLQVQKTFTVLFFQKLMDVYTN